MADIVIAHRNTEVTRNPSIDIPNKQIAWIVIHHDDGSREFFFPNENSHVRGDR